MEKEEKIMGLIKHEILAFTEWFFTWPFQTFSRLSANIRFCMLLTLAVNLLFKLFNATLTFQTKVNAASSIFLFTLLILERREKNGN